MPKSRRTHVEKRGRSMNRVAGGLLLLLFVASVARAQLPTATILGTVKDASGAVVPDATLTAQNRETGQKRNTVTSADGSYRFVALPVGTYEVRVEQQGFQSEVRGPITLTVTQEAVINFTLQLGSVEQTISVTAEAPMVNTTSSSLGGLVSEEQVSDLPLNGRNYLNLTLLQPGISQQRNKGNSTISIGTWISSNGAPLRSNNFLLDGAPMVDAGGATASSVSGNTLGLEGVREWKMITNVPSAEYGMTMGSQMVMVSKGGTNDFHGSLFEYFRNSVLDARNFFDLKSDASQRRLPAFVRNNFGTSLGGPIRRDKAFFFLTYEGLRERLGVTSILTTIPAAARVDGGAGGVAQIAAVIKPLLALYPLPNLSGDRYTYPFTQPTDDNYGQARVDLTFSEKDQLFVRGTADEGTERDTESFGPPFHIARQGRIQFYTLSESHIFGPALLNTARFSFSRTNKVTVSPSGLIGSQYSFAPGEEFGNISIGGIGGLGGNSVSPFNVRQNVFTWSDDLFYSRGRHSLKFGTLINHYQLLNFSSLNRRGSISFPSLTRFLQGLPSTSTVAKPDSVTDRTYQFNTIGFYAQDDLRANSRLTLNLGLRYEFLTQPEEVTGRGSALRDVRHDAEYTLGPPFTNATLKNFSPRFGFAWDVMGNGKTAVRGGFGLLYDLANYGSSTQVSALASPPFSWWITLSPYPGLLTLPLPTPAGTVRAVRPTDYYMQQPRLLQYNLTVERQLPGSMALTLSYVRTRGLHIMYITEGNPIVPAIRDGREFFPVPAPGINPRINPNWDTMEFHTPNSNSWYNGLQFGLSKRLSHGLQFQSSYTWSRCIDETQGQISGDTNADSAFGRHPLDRKADRGRCTFDATQNWRVNSLYRLPQIASAGGAAGALLNGWWLGAILTAETGAPFTPILTSNRSRDGINGGGAGDRPNLVSGRTWHNIVSGQSSSCLGAAAGRKLGGPELYFDPCAFSIPEAGYLGNLGRTTLSGPGIFTLDFTVAKDTPIRYLGENGKLEFRAEFFNILNRANFNPPNRSVFAGTADVQAPLGTAGQITSTVTSARQIQLALKLLF